MGTKVAADRLKRAELVLRPTLDWDPAFIAKLLNKFRVRNSIDYLAADDPQQSNGVEDQ